MRSYGFKSRLAQLKGLRIAQSFSFIRFPVVSVLGEDEGNDELL